MTSEIAKRTDELASATDPEYRSWIAGWAHEHNLI